MFVYACGWLPAIHCVCFQFHFPLSAFQRDYFISGLSIIITFDVLLLMLLCTIEGGSISLSLALYLQSCIYSTHWGHPSRAASHTIVIAYKTVAVWKYIVITQTVVTDRTHKNILIHIIYTKLAFSEYDITDAFFNLHIVNLVVQSETMAFRVNDSSVCVCWIRQNTFKLVLELDWIGIMVSPKMIALFNLQFHR